ncbi:hypothetical protein [Paraburkholderia youngii]|uniref:hypothetical protein n=1 Tax=Paraburkholderia youngii TaxID=2782701 RepID=UPI003D24D5C8
MSTCVLPNTPFAIGPHANFGPGGGNFGPMMGGCGNQFGGCENPFGPMSGFGCDPDDWMQGMTAAMGNMGNMGNIGNMGPGNCGPQLTSAEQNDIQNLVNDYLSARGIDPKSLGNNGGSNGSCQSGSSSNPDAAATGSIPLNPNAPKNPADGGSSTNNNSSTCNSPGTSNNTSNSSSPSTDNSARKDKTDYLAADEQMDPNDPMIQQLFKDEQTWQNAQDYVANGKNVNDWDKDHEKSAKNQVDQDLQSIQRHVEDDIDVNVNGSTDNTYDPGSNVSQDQYYKDGQNAKGWFSNNGWFTPDADASNTGNDDAIIKAAGGDDSNK